MMLSIFSCACWPFVYVFFAKISIQTFCSFLIVFFFFVFFFLMLSWMSRLFMLDINPLSVISFGNIFSHSVGCLLVFLMAPFEAQFLKFRKWKVSPDWWWTLFNKRKSLCHNRIGNFWVRETTVVKPTGSYMNCKQPGLKEIRSCQSQNSRALKQRSWADWQRRYSKLSSVLERSKAES